MNWRGGWSVSQQYYQNDVVVSAVNLATYILVVTSLFDGLDPSLSTSGDWVELSSPNTAVNSIREGVGITITGTTNPVITNNGVVTVTAGAGLINIGTENEPILENTGAVALQPGNGISITGSSQTPTITNIGVRSIQQGPGISVDLTNPNIPSISNNGVLTVNQGTGVTVDNTDPRNPIVSASVGFVNQIAGIAYPYPVMIPPTCIVGGQAIFPILTNGLFTSYLLDGAPSANGLFMINFVGYNLFFTNTSGSPVPPLNLVTIGFVDQTTAGGPYTYTANQNVALSETALYPINATMPTCIFDITAARTAGLRKLDSIVLTNNTDSQFVCPSTASMTAVYYPNGLE
jgi:hypothetical protein